MKAKVVILRCLEYSSSAVSEAIDKLFDLLEIKGFVKPKEKVLLKPNLLSPTLPEKGVTTHPVVVKEVAKKFKEMGLRVVLGDSPGGGISLEEVYEQTGMRKIAKELGIELVRFDKIRKVKEYPIAEVVFECDYFVSLPKLKTHALMTITGGIKNSFGLIPGICKTELHLKYPRPKEFSRVLVDIFSIRKPDLVIVDGVVSMAGEGPSAGVLRNTGVVLGSKDAVAIDAILAKILGLNPLNIFTLKEAYQRKLGEIEEIEILGEELNSVFLKDFPLPQKNFLDLFPQSILKMSANLIKTFPFINTRFCKGCEICLRSCPVKAISMDEKIKIDYQLCIKCLCCYEFCPHKAIYLKKGIILKIFDLMKCLLRH